MNQNDVQVYVTYIKELLFHTEMAQLDKTALSEDTKELAKHLEFLNGCRSFFRYFLLKASAFSATMGYMHFSQNITVVRSSPFTIGFTANDGCVMQTTLLGKVPEAGKTLYNGS